MLYPFNAKINTDGSYRNFYGWTVISMVHNREKLEYLEHYIKNNSILSSYFSPLPSESYHMTLCGVWNTGCKLLKYQEKFLTNNYSATDINNMRTDSQGTEFFNPKGCINELLKKIDQAISKIPTCDTENLIIDGIYQTNNTLHITFIKTEHFEGFDACTSTIKKLCEINKNNMVYHVTLAYKYKNIEPHIVTKINKLLTTFNLSIRGQKIKVEKPMVSYFSDMTGFITYKAALHCKSHEPIIWD